MIKTREQEYAAKIYDQVKDEVKGKSFQDDYKTSAKNLAFLIRSAGLVQALYFTESRNDGSKRLIKHLKDTLGNQSLLDDARNKSINEYMFLTEKCLLALKWYKRFVDIHIKDKYERNSSKSEVEKDDNEA